MALRRPPTRIELKADDIEEFEQVSGAMSEAMSAILVPSPGGLFS
jgi:hypothetical protein